MSKLMSSQYCSFIAQINNVYYVFILVLVLLSVTTRGHQRPINYLSVNLVYIFFGICFIPSFDASMLNSNTSNLSPRQYHTRVILLWLTKTV